MAYRANITFSGKITMIKGEVRELADSEVVADLLKCGYITDLSEKKKARAEAVEPKREPEAVAEEPKPEKKTRKGRGKNA